MSIKTVIRDFQNTNVIITGMRKRGKDMLMGNVIVRRDIPYISNTDYGGEFIRFDPEILRIGVTYQDFIKGVKTNYKFPYPDGTDIYIADCGVYFPSQYNGELNRDYKDIPTYMSLSRHLSGNNVHCNVQNFGRCWDKLREHCDVAYYCEWCKVLFGHIVVQSVIRYDKLDSCQNRVKPFTDFYPRRPFLNMERQQKWDIEKARYDLQHGNVKRYLLVYLNRSSYDSRIFKTMLEGGANDKKE